MGKTKQEEITSVNFQKKLLRTIQKYPVIWQHNHNRGKLGLNKIKKTAWEKVAVELLNEYHNKTQIEKQNFVQELKYKFRTLISHRFRHNNIYANELQFIFEYKNEIYIESTVKKEKKNAEEEELEEEERRTEEQQTPEEGVDIYLNLVKQLKTTEKEKNEPIHKTPTKIVYEEYDVPTIFHPQEQEQLNDSDRKFYESFASTHNRLTDTQRNKLRMSLCTLFANIDTDS